MKGLYRTAEGKVVCSVCLRPISKTGNIRKHFDDSHKRAKPILLKETEAHLYENGNDAVEVSTVMEQQAEMPMRPITKSGHIRKYFDDSH